MAKRGSGPEFSDRDGTSQRARSLAALNPDDVLVDERSAEDLLAFARLYGAELKYFGLDNKESGDWSAFVDPRLNLEEVAAFMEHPERFSPESSPLLFRPHFVLFLTFLRLLRRAQRDLNTFGRRHLDFYFREFLRLRGKPARPDRVNLVLDLASGAEPVRLRHGTLLTAGPDSLGRERLYATDRELLVNRAQVDRLSSVFVKRRITGLQEARDNHKNDHRTAALAMLEIAIGSPNPGDPLPDFPRDEDPEKEKEAQFGLLVEIAGLIGFAKTDLHLKFFELGELMKYLKQRRALADGEWARINTLLERAGRSRDPAFRLDRASRDFERNLVAAVGGEPPYNRLPEVDDVYDLFDQRTTQDARKFIGEQLFFDFERFVEMMQIKVKIDNEWNEINRLLETAGGEQRGDPGFQLPVRDPSDFEANLGSALPGLDFSTLDDVDSLDSYYAAVRQAEHRFFVTPDKLAYLLPKLIAPPSPKQEWRKVDEILIEAFREKRHTERRTRLQEVHTAHGFDAMIRHTLGEGPGSPNDESVLERLAPFLGGADDLARLERLRRDPGSAGAQEWQSAYRLIEIAQRNREGRVEPEPRKEEWLNTYPALDATTRTAGSTDDDGEAISWHTFGWADPRTEGDPPDPVLGWACSSPLLALSEGTRRIRLTLGFDARGFNGAELGSLLAGNLLDTGSPVRLQISTREGWVEPASVGVALGKYADLKAGNPSSGGREGDDALRFDLEFPDEADALAPGPSEVTGFEAPGPVLRLMLGQVWEQKHESYVTLYPHFRGLLLSTVHIQVSAKGLRPSHLQNDDAVLDSKNPFEPFGSSPAAGSRLLIGHPELVSKRLRSLAYRIEWMGVPASLKDHYRAYGLGGDPFTVALGLVERRVARPLKPKAKLFVPGDLSVEDVPSILSPLRYGRLAAAPPSEDLSEWDRYLQWELNEPDFQHRAYPTVASAKAVEMAAAIANRKEAGPDINAAKYQVNPPYTPKIKSLRIDYVSEVEVDLGRPLSKDSRDRILHVHPFGTCDADAERSAEGLPAEGVPLVPRYENEGELYVGVRDVSPPRTLSLLFQMAEGSADPDLSPEKVEWSFLSADRWVAVSDREILVDTTRGFRNSGIVELALGKAQRSRRLPGDIYWLRASAARNSASLCDTVAIHAQAVSATFVDNDNAPEHFARPLPPASIQKLVEPDPRIAEVRQPYTSEGGRMAEQDAAFNTRVSERLRHKQRAVTMWDYERLVLERFPEIFKAKCIPAGAGADGERPGAVRVVVIPDVRSKLPFDPFGPRAPADLLADTQQFLDAHTPPSASVEVVNPHYVAVKVRLAVRFRTSGNEGFFKQRLVDELNRFLSPWAYDEGDEIVIAGKVYANSIIDFLERRDYVDYVADIRLFTAADGEDFDEVPRTPGKSYFVFAGRPDGVLVAARQHVIDLIPDTGFEQELLTGINFMKVELDLKVAEDSPSS